MTWWCHSAFSLGEAMILPLYNNDGCRRVAYFPKERTILLRYSSAWGLKVEILCKWLHLQVSVEASSPIPPLPLKECDDIGHLWCRKMKMFWEAFCTQKNPLVFLYDPFFVSLEKKIWRNVGLLLCTDFKHTFPFVLNYMLRIVLESHRVDLLAYTVLLTLIQCY